MVGPLTLARKTGFDRELFRAGDSALFRQLVREVSPGMLAMIRCYAEDQDHADELLQESWVQIYRKRARFSGKGSFQGWALAVSRNVCRMSVRGSSRLVRVSLQDHGDIPDTAAGPAARLARRRRAKALYAALEKLTDRERQAIMLRLLEGWRTAEVAKAMGVREVSVRSLIHRGLRKLRRMKSLKQATLATEGLRQ
ncbi:MAG: sigma-70 family RNA polymerase sigma factor [Gemmatimonadetes bacterium]|nr:sigma-70 family RNA polymerase sigma factor [Gemmatimonadota bacterium]MYD12840.1 sigma-70 family RNA polymerase sigma factor [Gemmatimonadota bacterium]